MYRECVPEISKNAGAGKKATSGRVLQE